MVAGFKRARKRREKPMPTDRPLPRYQCHKKVCALKIAAIEQGEDGMVTITPEDNSYQTFKQTSDYWVHRYKGDEADLGYYVPHDDGFASWSPSKAFEEGYSRID